MKRRWIFVIVAGVAAAYWCEKAHNIQMRDILLHTLKKNKDNEEEQKHKEEASTKSHKNVEVEHEALVTITDLTPQLIVALTSGMWVVQFYENLSGARLIRDNEFKPQLSFVCAEVEVGSNRFVVTNKDYQ
ncbi:hypothetical protein ACE6H2_002965 [Prunus campanulata]